MHALKLSLLRGLKHVGVPARMASSTWRLRRLLILCYHGVSLSDEHEWNPGLYVSASHLDERLTLLRRIGCTVLPLHDALERLYARALPDRAVALTFDDGYYDFAARAWPLLRAHGVPATVYLTTGRVDHNLPNVALFMSYVLWKARDRTLDGRGLPGLDGSYALCTDRQRATVLQRIGRALTANPQSELDKDTVARLLAERLGLDYRVLLTSRLLTLMRPGEVARCAREGLDVQMHTHFHRTPDDPRVFLRDVIVNRDRIETMTGTRPRHFCYPSGDYRTGYLPLLRHEGIVSAATCDPGIATSASDPLLLPRFIDTTPMSSIVFEAWVTGVAACLPRRTRRGGALPGPRTAPTRSWLPAAFLRARRQRP